MLIIVNLIAFLECFFKNEYAFIIILCLFIKMSRREKVLNEFRGILVIRIIVFLDFDNSFDNIDGLVVVVKMLVDLRKTIEG